MNLYIVVFRATPTFVFGVGFKGILLIETKTNKKASIYLQHTGQGEKQKF